MAITEVIPTFSTPEPNRAQSPEDFADAADLMVSEFNAVIASQNVLAGQINSESTTINGYATAAAASATSAANSSTAASGHANRAEDAAAAAEQAAGLTQDPDFGMVVTTTSNPDVKIATFTATVGRMQDVDTSAGAFGITTPASPAVGQWFGIRDYNQQAFYGKFPWFIYGSDKIIGLAENCTIDVNTMIFTYRGATKGWCI